MYNSYTFSKDNGNHFYLRRQMPPHLSHVESRRDVFDCNLRQALQPLKGEGGETTR